MGGLFNFVADSSGRKAAYPIPPGYKPKGRQIGVRSVAMAAAMAASSSQVALSPATARRKPSGDYGPDGISVSLSEALPTKVQGLVFHFQFSFGCVCNLYYATVP